MNILKSYTMATFRELINSDKPVLVDFHAEWCGPSKMMPQILKELKEMMKDNITILKIDVDKNPQVADAFGIQGVPTLIIFRMATSSGGKPEWPLLSSYILFCNRSHPK